MSETGLRKEGVMNKVSQLQLERINKQLKEIAGYL